VRREDVDLLIEAGRSAVLNSMELRDFLNGHALAPQSNARPAGVRE
jgi:hypothetical protein